MEKNQIVSTVTGILDTAEKYASKYSNVIKGIFGVLILKILHKNSK